MRKWITLIILLVLVGVAWAGTSSNRFPGQTIPEVGDAGTGYATNIRGWMLTTDAFLVAPNFNEVIASTINFGVNGSPIWTEGLIFYDGDNDALTVYNDEADIGLQVGQESYFKVKNSTGSTITDASLVYINGASGGVPTIALSKADATTTALIAGVATHNIENNTTGYVTTQGLVKNIDTTGCIAGDRIYLSAASAGAFTKTAPTSAFVIPVGYITAVGSTNGALLVTNIGGPEAVAPVYAAVYASSETVVINTVDTLYLASDGWVVDVENGVDYNGTTGLYTIGAGNAGDYFAGFFMSIAGGNSDLLQVDMYKAGVIQNSHRVDRKLGVGGDIGSLGITNALNNVSVGDTIKLITQQDTTTTNQTITHGSFWLYRVNQ
jgi:hypothetical protein